MLLNKYEKEYRQYLSYQKRLKEIRKELRERPLIRLKHPYQSGWDIYLDFRDDIKNRKDFPYIKAAFDLVHRNGYTRKANHIREIRHNRNFNSYTYSKLKKINIMPTLSSIPQRVYDKLSGSVKKWFAIDVYNEKYLSFTGHSYYLHIPLYYLVVKTRPHMITHMIERGGDLEKEYDFLDKKMEPLWRKFDIGYSTSYPAHKDRARLRSQISKYIKAEVEDIYNEKVPRIYKY